MINLFDIRNLYELRLILFTKVISSAAFHKDPFCANHCSVVKAKIIYTIQRNKYGIADLASSNIIIKRQEAIDKSL